MFVNKSTVGTVVQVGTYVIKVVTVQKPQVLLSINDISKVFIPGSEFRLPEGVIKVIRFQKGRRFYLGLDFPKEYGIIVSNPHARIEPKTESHSIAALVGCTSG